MKPKLKEKMTQQEYIDGLVERETHCDTMKALTPLERQHLQDWKDHFEKIQNDNHS